MYSFRDLETFLFDLFQRVMAHVELWMCIACIRSNEPIRDPRVRCAYAQLLNRSHFSSYNTIMSKIMSSASAEEVEERVNAFPFMAYILDRNGVAALHYACHPLLCGDVWVIRRLLEIYPDAVRMRDNKENARGIPLNWVFSYSGFGDEDPAKVLAIASYKGRDFPNNGWIYTPRNKSICQIVTRLVDADPSTLTMTTKFRFGEVPLNPIQQLWVYYESSAIGKKEIEYVRANSVSFIESLSDGDICYDERFGGMVVVWQLMAIMVRALYYHISIEARGYESTPLIHACVGIGDHCSLPFLDFFLALDPDQASRRDTKGNLPLHIAAKSTHFKSSDRKAACIEKLAQLYPKGPNCRNDERQLPITVGIIQEEECGPWVAPLLNVGVGSMEWDKYLLCAASSESKASLDMTYQVLRANPNVILMEE